jgi:flagellar M-ring protein FliF
VEKFLKQAGEFLRALSRNQKLLLGAAALVVVVVLGLFVKLTEKADFKTLYSGLATTDAQAVVQRLAAKNIPYEVSTDGTSVSVPADQLDRTRLDLAAEGMPQTGRLGFELFDKPNWAGSDFAEQVNYQRALEGELERTIQTLGNVESVRVHLVLPHESLFSDRERLAKAAVVMKLRGGGLSDDEVNAVTHLVASAVDNLSPENVTLIGADGRTPLVAKGRDPAHGAYAPVELEAGMAEKLIATLTPIVGPDHVKASVTLAYDQSSGDTTQEIYDPTNPVMLTYQVQEERFGGSPPAGIPGTTSNVPNAPANSAAKLAIPGTAALPGAIAAGAAAPAAGSPTTATAATPPTAPVTPAPPSATIPGAATIPPAAAAAGGVTVAGQPSAGPPVSAAGKASQANQLNPMISISSESDGQRSESRTFAVSKTLRHISDPAGRIQKIAAAVLVDDFVEMKDDKGKSSEMRRKRTPEEMKQIEDLARAAIGFDPARGDVLSVQNVSFVYAPVEKVTPPAVIERVRVVAEKWIWLGRYVLMFIFFGIIYMLVLRPIKEQLMKSFEHPGAPVPALAGGAEESMTPQEMAALAQEQLQMELGRTNSDVERVIRLKKHLTEKVKREPALASALIRQWINEEKKD